MAQVEKTTAPADQTVDSSAGSGRASLVWMMIACLLLIGSGLNQTWQNQRHQVEMNYSEDCPFLLKSIPKTLGGWKQTGGGDQTLDDRTMRITGGTEHLIRTYSDELTGVSLMVLVLFGPAEPVIPHTPEVCYPSCGFTLAEELNDRVIKSPGGLSSRFRSAVYSRSNGRGNLREEVYYSFRLEGEWSPDPGGGRKFPRKNPSVFKIQVQRRVAEGERRDLDDPIAQFLALLVPAVEKGIASKEKTPPKTSMNGLRPSTIPDPLVLGGFSRVFDHRHPQLVALDSALDRGSDPSSEFAQAANHEYQDQNRGQINQEDSLNGEPDWIATSTLGDSGKGDRFFGIRSVRRMSHRRPSLLDWILQDLPGDTAWPWTTLPREIVLSETQLPVFAS